MVNGSRVLDDPLPPFTTATLNSQRLASLQVRDDLIVSVPSKVRLIRNTIDDVITTSP
jgi:hypothetical protein